MKVCFKGYCNSREALFNRLCLYDGGGKVYYLDKEDSSCSYKDNILSVEWTGVVLCGLDKLPISSFSSIDNVDIEVEEYAPRCYDFYLTEVNVCDDEGNSIWNFSKPCPKTLFLRDIDPYEDLTKQSILDDPSSSDSAIVILYWRKDGEGSVASYRCRKGDFYDYLQRLYETELARSMKYDGTSVSVYDSVFRKDNGYGKISFSNGDETEFFVDWLEEQF